MDDPMCPPPARLEIPHINRETDDAVDRISDLPEQIIHHIASFLPTAEATRVSAVSKTFRSVMDSFPVIDFDFYFFLKNSNTRFKHREETIEKFLSYVDETIKRRRSHELDCCMQKFRLTAHVPSFGYFWSWIKWDHQISRAISFAIERGVKELQIALPFYERFPFPKLITSSAQSSSITTLKLKGFELDLNDLSLRCPMIESLSLVECTLKDFNILIPNVRALDLQRCDCGSGMYGMKIEAVNLQSFTCGGEGEFFDVEMGACKNLKNLVLYDLRIVVEWLQKQISQFHGLENLTLEECRCPWRVEISHQNLRSLCLLDVGAEDVKVDAPTLVSFMYKGNYVPIRLLNLRAAADLDATLVFWPWRCENVECFVRFQNLLSSFRHCKALTLCCFGEDLIFPGCLRDADCQLCNLKHLKLITDILPCYTKLVDSLLWLAPHLETLCFSSIKTILDSSLCDLKHFKVIMVSMPCYTKLVDGFLWLAHHLETLCSSIETKDQVSKAKFIRFYCGNTQGGVTGGGGGGDSNRLVEMVNIERDNLLKYFQEKLKSYYATLECEWIKKYLA